MQQTFFKTPFGVNGDVAAIPFVIQPDGSVSFDAGYGFDYERDATTDPLAKNIDRQPFNWLMRAITQQLQQTQIATFPEFITSADNGGTAYPYPAKAVIRYRPTGADPWNVYISKEDNNTTTPLVVGNKWEASALFKSTSAQAVAGTDGETIITPATLLAALDNAFATRLPSRYLPGDLVITFGSTPSPNTLVCNGAAVGRAAYPALFSRIGTLYGAGNGTTTFNLPNVGNGYTLIAANGTAVGSVTGGQNASHTHGASSNAAGWHGHNVGSYGAGGHAHSVNSSPGVGQGQSGPNTVQQAGGSMTTSAVGDHVHVIYLDGNGEHTHVINIAAQGAAANYAAGMYVLHTIAF